MFNKKGQKGFTLIELLLVVAIIGILAAVALPKFNPDQTEAKIAKIKANLENLETAAELYKVKHGKYPATIGAMVTDGQLKRDVPDPEFGGSYGLQTSGAEGAPDGVATWTKTGGTTARTLASSDADFKTDLATP